MADTAKALLALSLLCIIAAACIWFWLAAEAAEWAYQRTLRLTARLSYAAVDSRGWKRALLMRALNESIRVEHWLYGVARGWE